MVDLTDEDRANIRSFVENKDGSYPGLDDLVAVWDFIGPDARNHMFPDIYERNMQLTGYLTLAPARRWAWDGLKQLHKVLMERGEPIPVLLQDHINEAYHGLLKRPINPNRSPQFAPKDNRDYRIMRAVRALRKRGSTREQAILDVAEATGMPSGTFESAVGKMERLWSTSAKKIDQLTSASETQATIAAI